MGWAHGRALPFSPVPKLVLRFINYINTVSLHIKVNLSIEISF
jgi:hypothetical protein